MNTAPLTVDGKPVLHRGHRDTDAVIVFFLLHVVRRLSPTFRFQRNTRVYSVIFGFGCSLTVSNTSVAEIYFATILQISF